VPPNFVLLVTDQHKADHLGFGGNELLRTPQLDGLAERGMVFDRAFVANPICMPNRSTIMTGRMPSVHGTRMNGISLDWHANTFVRVLREHGYRTSHVGKSHLQNMGVPKGIFGGLEAPGEGEAIARDLPDGWDDLEGFRRYHQTEPVPLPDDFYGFERADFAIMHGDMCSGHYYQWLLAQGIDPETLRGVQNALEVFPGWGQVYHTAVPVELYPSSYVAMRAEQEIADAAADGRPFFLHCSWPDPHHPFTPPGDYWSEYDPGEIPLPESFGDAHERCMPHVRAMLEKRGTPGVPVHGWAPSEDQYRHAAAAEYGMISLIDDCVGRVLAALERAGVADDTVVVFTSDHGDMFGEHGLLLKHALHYEACTRVPLVVRRPGATPGRTRSLAGSIDLGQTILELAGLPAYHDMQGRSLVPILEDPSAGVRDGVLIEEDEPDDMLGVGSALRMRTLVTAEGRLSVYRGHEHGELYDLRRDPLELENLFGTPAGAALQARLMHALSVEMMRVAPESPRATCQA
jgi:arylsulfatase A-like enzyme